MPPKESVLVILDLTPDLLSDNSRGLAEMISAVAGLISQLLFDDSKPSVGLLLLSSSQLGLPEEPETLEAVFDLAPAKLSHLRKVRQLYQTISESSHMMCGGKRHKKLSKIATEVLVLADRGPESPPKEQKRIILFTTGTPQFPDSIPEALEFHDRLKSIQVDLDLYLVGAAGESAPDNLQPFLGIPSRLPGSGLRVFYGRDFQTYLTLRKSKLAKSTSKFKGNFELSPINFIAVNILRHTAKDAPLQFSKHCRGSGKGDELTFHNVKQQSSYVHPEDPHLRPLAEEKIVRNFRYGQQLIPATAEISEGIKGDNEKCLKLLGFVAQSMIPRTSLMGFVDSVFPCQESLENKRAFHALTQAMIDQKKTALVRFVARKNDSPKLAALFPKKLTDEATSQITYVLYLVELPTIEDIREYNFGSSIKSNAIQQTVVGDLIEAMRIDGLTLEEQEDLGLARPTLSRNPYLDMVEDRLVEVGLMGPGEASDPALAEQSAARRAFPERVTRKRVKEVAPRIQTEFGLRENETRPEGEQRVFWSELLTNREIEEKRKAEKDGPGKEDRVTRDLSKATPKEDFREMLRNKKEDLVMRAVTQMSGLILELVRSAGEGGQFNRPMDYLTVLREGCVTEDEPDAFNDLLRELRDEVSREPGMEGLLDALQEREFCLISRRESHRSAVPEDYAKNFLFEHRPVQRQRTEPKKTPAKDWMNMIE